MTIDFPKTQLRSQRIGTEIAPPVSAPHEKIAPPLH